MIYDIATLLERPAEELGEEVTVRCRIQSNRIPGEGGGALKSIYVVDDVHHTIDERVALSFWSSEPLEEPLRSLVSKTEDYVLDAVGLPLELEEGTGMPLQRGEEVIVRAVPNRSEESESDLYLNVTSVVIREPSRLIGKSEVRTQDNCPRENYLRHIKQVYTGDRYNRPPYLERSLFQGDVVHRIAERALDEYPERFTDRGWTEANVQAFCETIFEEEFGFRQALLVISGAGLQVREWIVENVLRLFTDESFLTLVDGADTIVTERPLDDDYGCAGRVDILLDGVPYDIKTTRDPDDAAIARHAHQVKFYVFALLVSSLADGDGLRDRIEDGIEGALIYPNTTSDTVRIEPVELTIEDAARFIRLRNQASSARASFAPPSPYNRDCESCQFAAEEWITNKDDALPPACTYHCQDERRWPCYDLDESGAVQSDCSRFDDCDQRLIYRDTDKVAYYDRTRTAFQSEQEARRSATQILAQFGSDLLETAGYQLSGLSVAGATAAGSILRFTSETPVVPAFAAGDSVRLRSTDSAVSARATYYGKTDDEYRFKIETRGISIGDLLTNGGPFEVTYRFSTDNVARKLLPYLDFAQRRDISPGFTEGEISDDGGATIDSPDAISDFIGYDEVFVDVPVSQNRSRVLAELVETIVSTPVPVQGSSSETIPTPATRTLVLGTNPYTVECAVQGQPDGDHYRLDETGGGQTAITAEDSYHDIQDRLMNARSVVSTTQLVTSKNGPGGIREFFHKLQEGDFKSDDDLSKRSHSQKFFDQVVILGGENLTEPEYHFISDLGDRSIVIGDTRREGPSIISSHGIEAGLNRSYLEQAFEHYRSFPASDSVSVQVTGDSPRGLQELYPDGPWDHLNGDLAFAPVSHGEEQTVDVIELTTTVRADHTARRLVFDVTDTPVSPIEAQEMFQNRHSLDATRLETESVVLIDELSLYLAESGDTEGENTNSHEIVIRATAAELPLFSRALLTNEPAEKRVVELVRQNPDEFDVIVTPYESHATAIKRRLADADVSLPVERPETLTGDIRSHALISFGVGNESHIVRPPLDDPEVLYMLLSSGVDLTFVGHAETLSTKDVFEGLLDAAETLD